MSDADLNRIVSRTLAAEIQAAANEERRPVAAIVREAFECYLEVRRWRRQAEQEAATAEAMGSPRDDRVDVTDGYREIIREQITQGMKSAKEARLVDGETVFARLMAELDALEAPDHRLVDLFLPRSGTGSLCNQSLPPWNRRGQAGSTCPQSSAASHALPGARAGRWASS